MLWPLGPSLLAVETIYHWQETTGKSGSLTHWMGICCPGCASKIHPGTSDFQYFYKWYFLCTRKGLQFIKPCWRQYFVEYTPLYSRPEVYPVIGLAQHIAFFLTTGSCVSEPHTRVFLCVRTRDTLNIFLEWWNSLKKGPNSNRKLVSVCLT